MANFIESELEALAKKVAAEVLSQLQPSLSGLADSIVAKVVAEVTSVLESKLGTAPPA